MTRKPGLYEHYYNRDYDHRNPTRGTHTERHSNDKDEDEE
jgi:hypothetical protein